MALNTTQAGAKIMARELREFAPLIERTAKEAKGRRQRLLDEALSAHAVMVDRIERSAVASDEDDPTQPAPPPEAKAGPEEGS